MQIEFTETELLTIENTLLSGYPPDNSIEMQIVKKIQSTMFPSVVTHKRILVTHCNSKLLLVKCIVQNTKKSLFEAKSIADTLMGTDNKCNGTLLLNESSMTPEQWEAVVTQYDNTESCNDHIEWNYV